MLMNVQIRPLFSLISRARNVAPEVNDMDGVYLIYRFSSIVAEERNGNASTQVAAAERLSVNMSPDFGANRNSLEGDSTIAFRA